MSVAKRVFVFLFLWTSLFSSAALGAEPVAFLGVDSDDAEEEAQIINKAVSRELQVQTQATAPKLSSSFTTLSAAARCPERPDVPCLSKIGKLIKQDQFIWGLVRRDGEQLRVELHRYQDGSGPIYSVKIGKASAFNAKEAVAKLLENAVATELEVVCATPDGVLWIDGHARTILRSGRAHTFLTPNEAHAIEIRVGGKALSSTSLKPEGTRASWTCASAGPLAPSDGQKDVTGGTSGGRVAGYALLGASALAATVATIYTVKFVDYKSALDEARASVPPSVTDVCTSSLPKAISACSEYQSANSSRTAAIIAGATGAALLGAGLYFSLRSEDAAVRATVAPTIDAKTVGANLTVSF